MIVSRDATCSACILNHVVSFYERPSVILFCSQMCLEQSWIGVMNTDSMNHCLYVPVTVERMGAVELKF